LAFIDEALWGWPLAHLGPVREREGGGMATYHLIETEAGEGIVCHACGSLSYDRDDMARRYCSGCDHLHTLDGDDVGEMTTAPCPMSGKPAVYRGRTGAAHGVACPGCGHVFRLLDVWRPAPEGYDLMKGAVLFPDHDLPAGLPPRKIVHPEQPKPKERRELRPVWWEGR
jgi:hypothetical protein